MVRKSRRVSFRVLFEGYDYDPPKISQLFRARMPTICHHENMFPERQRKETPIDARTD
jgi:hypothetical protein